MLLVEDFASLADWTQWPGAGGEIWGVAAGQGRCTTNVGAAVHSTPLDTADHCALFFAVDTGGTGQFSGPAVRASADGATGYCLYLGPRTPAGEPNVSLSRFDGATRTLLGEATTAYVAGSYFVLGAHGPDIFVRDATGAEVIRVTDTTYSGRHAGLYGFGSNFKTTDHWSAFDLSTVLSDGFDRPDSDLHESGPGWDCFGDSIWGVRSGKAQILSTATSTRYALLTLPSSDHEVTATLARGSSGSVGIAVRYITSGNILGVRLPTSGGLGIFKTVNGATTIIQEGILSYPGAGTRYGLRVVGDTVTAKRYDDGGSVVQTWSGTITDSVLLSGNRVGIRGQGNSNQPTWDDVTVESFMPPPTNLLARHARAAIALGATARQSKVATVFARVMAAVTPSARTSAVQRRSARAGVAAELSAVAWETELTAARARLTLTPRAVASRVHPRTARLTVRGAVSARTVHVRAVRARATITVTGAAESLVTLLRRAAAAARLTLTGTAAFGAYYQDVTVSAVTGPAGPDVDVDGPVLAPAAPGVTVTVTGPTR